MTAHGVQIIKVFENHTYELNEEETALVLLRDDIKDLPVVVVSVAGAYRRGKSFLLNFFLRYLTASPTARSDGSWIGDDTTSLLGFNWSTGTKRNTTGILFWSEPFQLSLPNENKVAVILMDTQGTFDGSSTAHDNSFVFALSTLLSSVQIYNISGIIQEDNLQHLQLFTEYGKMVKTEDGSKAFQVLQFLIRDWQNPDEFEYGAAGGNQYLKGVLEIKPNMAQETKELREHISSSFEKVTCFLMPHPGSKVTRKVFSGKVSEIDAEFITYLKELVPTLFNPENLTTKRVNGECIRVKDLFTYLKSYMQIMNSDQLPPTNTILVTTITAGMLIAVQEARAVYDNGMDEECGPKQPSMTGYDLQDVHNKYVGLASSKFTTKKKLGSSTDANEYLSKLTKELENRLPLYQNSNIAKTQGAIKRADAAYDTEIFNVTKGSMLCVHAKDLIETHNRASNAAMKIFDASRKPNLTGKEDLERSVYLEGFEERFLKLRNDNERNNTMNAIEIRETYLIHMQSLSNVQPPVSETVLTNEHNAASQKALEEFESKRNLTSNQYDEDSFKYKLLNSINKSFISMKEVNRSNNRVALTNSIEAYKRYMNSAWDAKLDFLHELDIKKEHDSGLCQAMMIYRPQKTCQIELNKNDPDEKTLLDSIEQRYHEIKTVNDKANESAVQEAVGYYRHTMAELCRPTAYCWSTEQKLNSEKRKFHNDTSKEAVKRFKSKRRPCSFVEDDYEKNLNNIINELFKKYLGKN